jgi:hypothetical protein
MVINNAQMDQLTLAVFGAGLGLFPDDHIGDAMWAAAPYEDSEVSPVQLARVLEMDGIRARHVVWPTTDLTDIFSYATKRYPWALAWMEPDTAHAARWWTILHYCDDGTRSITLLIDSDPEKCGCAPLQFPWTGHAVVIDHVPVPVPFTPSRRGLYNLN